MLPQLGDDALGHGRHVPPSVCHCLPGDALHRRRVKHKLALMAQPKVQGCRRGAGESGASQARRARGVGAQGSREVSVSERRAHQPAQPGWRPTPCLSTFSTQHSGLRGGRTFDKIAPQNGARSATHATPPRRGSPSVPARLLDIQVCCPGLLCPRHGPRDARRALSWFRASPLEAARPGLGGRACLRARARTCAPGSQQAGWLCCDPRLVT